MELNFVKIFSLSKLDCTQTVQINNALEIQKCVELIIRFSNSAEG